MKVNAFAQLLGSAPAVARRVGDMRGHSSRDGYKRLALVAAPPNDRQYCLGIRNICGGRGNQK